MKGKVAKLFYKILLQFSISAFLSNLAILTFSKVITGIFWGAYELSYSGGDDGLTQMRGKTQRWEKNKPKEEQVKLTEMSKFPNHSQKDKVSKGSTYIK